MAFRLALVGTGPMAAAHARALRCVPELSVVTAVSRDPAKAAAFASAHGVPDARAFEEFLRRPGDVDGIWVVVPAESMHETAIALSAHGLPLFLEKPVGLSPAEARLAREGVAVPHMVGLNRRFYEVLRRGRRLVEEAGGLTGIEVHMPESIKPLAERYGRHVLDRWAFGNSVHLVDLFRFFAGEPRRVEAIRAEREWWDRSVVAALAFEGGACGVFHAHWGAPGGWRVAVTAEDLQIVFQPIEKGTILRRGRDPEPLVAQGPDAVEKAGLAGQAEAFLALIETGRLPEGAADLADYERSVGLVAAIFGTGAVAESRGGST